MITTHFLDDNNNIVPKEESTHFIVRETDENGKLISETFGRMNKKPGEESKNVFEEEVTPEMQEILDNYKDKNGNYMFRK